MPDNEKFFMLSDKDLRTLNIALQTAEFHMFGEQGLFGSDKATREEEIANVQALLMRVQDEQRNRGIR